MKGPIVGLVIGAALLAAGAFVFASGIGKPGIVPVPVSRGVVGGNLALSMGIILMMAGLAALGGIISVEIANWEGGSDESPDN